MLKKILSLVLCAMIFCSVAAVFAEDSDDPAFGFMNYDDGESWFDSYGWREVGFASPGDTLTFSADDELILNNYTGDLFYRWFLYYFDDDGFDYGDPWDCFYLEKLSHNSGSLTMNYPDGENGIPIPAGIVAECYIEDRDGERSAQIDFMVYGLMYALEPEEAEYVKGSASGDMVFTVKSLLSEEGVFESAGIGYPTDEYMNSFGEYESYDRYDLDSDYYYFSDGKLILKETFLESLDVSDKPYEIFVGFIDPERCYYANYLTKAAGVTFEDVSDPESTTFHMGRALLTVKEQVADTDDATGLGIYAITAIISIIGIAAVVVGKKRLSVR